MTYKNTFVSTDKSAVSFRLPRAFRGVQLGIYFALLATLLIRAVPASAQGPATGTPAFGSYGGGPDVINLANLNSHLTIPILHKPGRGTNFSYDLSYDSSIWFAVTSGGTTSWTSTANLGWTSESLAVLGYLYASTTSKTVIVKCTGGFGSVTTDTTTYAYFDSRGTLHPFPGSTYYQYTGGGCTGSSYGPTLIAQATDGSGYTLTALANQTGDKVTTASGLIVSTNLGIGSGAYQDRNGNQLTVNNTTGQFFDTLSASTPVLTQSGSGTSSSPVKYTYTAPSGASAYYQVNYSNYTVATNFGVSGVGEYKSSAAVPLVTSIVLPDGTQYTFAYEATPSIPSSGACTPYAGTTCTTARVTSITLPTGGTITYAYSGGNNGIMPDGSVATLTRTTPDGIWTYTRTAETGAAYVTKVTDPQSNDTLIQFQGFYETQRDAYQGLAPSFSTFPIPESTLQTSGLLRETQTCYNTSTIACTNTAISPPITQRTSTTKLSGASSWASAPTSQHVYKYSSTGSLTEQDDYDYGVGAVGALLKKTAITYATLTNITSFRQLVTVTNGAGTTISQTNYNYGDTVTGTSGTPQHTTPSGSRGNLLSVNYYTHSSTYITKSISYFDTGNVQTITDVNGAQTTYTYGACGNSFPTNVAEPLSLSKSMTWNCTGGVQLTTTDENSQVTTTGYNDPYFWRPASVTDPTTAVANLTYTGQTEVEASLSFNSGSSAQDVLSTRDGLGRPHLSQIRETPGGTNFDSSETDYDSDGRPYRVTLPYVGTAGQTNSSAPSKNTTYDALGRILSISDNSGGTRTYSYLQNTVYVTRGPAPTGENTKRRQEQYDALGRLTSVCEITAGTSGAPAGTCAQNVSQTGYWTKYTYDALGRLTGVSQNAQSSNPQARSYVYDLLGRMTSEANTETGTITRVYDTDATCGTSNADVVKKTDALGNVTCVAYDTLHRPTAITYPSGTYAGATAPKHFVYDAATVNSVPMVNAKGRLAEAYTCTSTCTPKATDEGFSYTVRAASPPTFTNRRPILPAITT